MRDFVVPQTDTKILGKIYLEYAFKLTAHYDPPQESHTPRGTFRYQDIVGGEVSGERPASPRNSSDTSARWAAIDSSAPSACNSSR